MFCHNISNIALTSAKWIKFPLSCSCSWSFLDAPLNTRPCLPKMRPCIICTWQQHNYFSHFCNLFAASKVFSFSWMFTFSAFHYYCQTRSGNVLGTSNAPGAGHNRSWAHICATPTAGLVPSRATALHVDPGRKSSNHAAAFPSGTNDLLSQCGWQEWWRVLDQRSNASARKWQDHCCSPPIGQT